jgi:tetratricopeptide (TPR) repeat protein
LGKIYEQYLGRKWRQAARRSNVYYRTDLPCEVGIKIGNKIRSLGGGPFKKLPNDVTSISAITAVPSAQQPGPVKAPPQDIRSSKEVSAGMFYSLSGLVIPQKHSFDIIAPQCLKKQSPKDKHILLTQYFAYKTINDKNPEAHILFGATCIEMYETTADRAFLKQAARSFGKAKNSDQTKARAYEGLGIVDLIQSDFCHAMICFNKALSFDPTLEKAKELQIKASEAIALAHLTSLEPKLFPQELSRIYHEHEELHGSALIAKMMAELLIKDSKLEEAETCIVNALKHEQDSPELLIMLRSVHIALISVTKYELGKHILSGTTALERADKLRNEIFQLDPENFHGKLLAIEILISENSVSEARKAIEKLAPKASTNKGKALVFKLYSRIEFAEGYKLAAKERLEMAKKLDPEIL